MNESDPTGDSCPIIPPCNMVGGDSERSERDSFRSKSRVAKFPPAVFLPDRRLPSPPLLPPATLRPPPCRRQKWKHARLTKSPHWSTGAVCAGNWLCPGGRSPHSRAASGLSPREAPVPSSSLSS